ncbi:MAG: hypothetical protein F4Y74_10875 [Gemmatimonadales bacterium]|nr:hypothetical protein [Gemmatimonadales bacterium]
MKQDMTNGDLGWITNYIWGIADDVLRDVYVRGKYRDVILPMTVLRRLDAVLEPTKQAVLDMKDSLDEIGVADQEVALRQAAGQAFYNTSKFTLHDLRARANPQQLRADFEDYLDGFSPSVQDILDNFELRNQTFGGRKRFKRGKAKADIGDGGSAHMTTVVGMKDRKTNRVVVGVIDAATKANLHAFVESHRKADAKLYTDEHRGYEGLDNRDAAKHSVGEYVREVAHTNGIESFLEHDEDGLSRHLPPSEREASGAVRLSVRWQAQHQRHGHGRADGARLWWA